MKLWHKLLIVLAVTSGSTLGVTNLLNQPNEDLVFGATKAPATQGGTNLDAYRKGDLLYSPASISLASPGANSLARLASGSAGQCLIMSGGIPAWSSSCGGGSSNFTGLDFGVIGGTQVKITSQSFDAGMFDLSDTASHGFVRLDWVNGPASRSSANIWTALNTFSAGASVSGSLEVSGTASISTSLRVGGNVTILQGSSILNTGGGNSKLTLSDAAGTTLAYGGTNSLVIGSNSTVLTGPAGSLNIGLVTSTLDSATTIGGTNVTGTEKALVANNNTSTGNIFEAQDNGSAVFTIFDGGMASLSGTFEIAGYSSASAYFSGGLATCNGSNFLQWSAGLFGCAAGGGGGVASSSLDWDEFVVNMTLDQTHSVASAGFNLNWGYTDWNKIGIASAQGYVALVGTAASPSYTFMGDRNTGIYRVVQDTVTFSGGGTRVLDVGSGGITAYQGIASDQSGGFNMRRLNGTASIPTYGFTNDQDTGMYNIGADIIGFSSGTIRIGSVSASGWEFGGTASASRFYAGDGSTALPAFSFGSDKATGITLGSGGVQTLGIIANGVEAVQVRSNILYVRTDIEDPNTTNSFHLEGDGASLGAPTYAFSNDPDTGILALNTNPNVLQVSAGGVRVASGSQAGWEFGGTASISNIPAISATSTALCLEAGGLIERNTGSPTCTVSSLKYKDNVRDLDLGLEELLKLRPVAFTAKGTEKEAIGFIAEEVVKIDPRLVFFEADGKDPRGVNYEMFAPWVVEAIQEQQAQINALATGQPVGSTMQTLEEQIDALSIWQLLKLIIYKLL